MAMIKMVITIMINMIITMMINVKLYITLIFLTVFLSVNAQENSFKEFAEQHNDRAFCFYPSTIRMLNIGDNPEFNNMVSGIEKLLVYNLDSISIADRLYDVMLDDFSSMNYNELVSIAGGGYETLVLGSPQDIESQFVGVVVLDNISVVFYMRGDINWEEIPKMISSFNNDDFINVLDLNFKGFDKHH